MSDHFSSSPTSSTSEELYPLFDETLDSLCGHSNFFEASSRQSLKIPTMGSEDVFSSPPPVFNPYFFPESQELGTVVPETGEIFDVTPDSPELRVSDTELQDSDIGSSIRSPFGLFRKRMAPDSPYPIKIERKKVVFRGEESLFRILQCFCPTVTWESASFTAPLLSCPPLKLVCKN
ncbi:hypothetical protein OROMI_015764 [Orobanche minor]